MARPGTGSVYGVSVAEIIPEILELIAPRRIMVCHPDDAEQVRVALSEIPRARRVEVKVTEFVEAGTVLVLNPSRVILKERDAWPDVIAEDPTLTVKAEWLAEQVRASIERRGSQVTFVDPN